MIYTLQHRWVADGGTFLALSDVRLMTDGFLIDDLPLPTFSPSFFNHDVDSLSELRTTTMDEGDILLCCPTKTGQHWNFEIISMLLKGRAEYSTICKETSWMDIHPISMITKQVTPPRVLCTHLAMGCLPTSLRYTQPCIKILQAMVAWAVESWYYLQEAWHQGRVYYEEHEGQFHIAVLPLQGLPRHRPHLGGTV